MLDLETLETDARETLFRPRGPREWRVGAEVEWIPVNADTRKVAAFDDGTRRSVLSTLRRTAAIAGWRETRSAYGTPAFELPGAGLLSFEPGGQIELSTIAFETPSELVSAIARTSSLLREATARDGIELLECGLDPFNRVEDAPLLFETPRYSRMSAHFARIGPWGARMMRQTASFQLSVDVHESAMAHRFSVFNSIAPFVVAAFANSPYCQGVDTGVASTRAMAWRELDPTRTGLVPGSDSAAEYVRFALGASAFLVGDPANPAVAFGELLDAPNVGLGEWREHLTTLFPEVRPRGHIEMRGADMTPNHAHATLVMLLVSLARDDEAAGAASEIAGAPDPSLLSRASGGLDVETGPRASQLFAIALATAKREPAGFWSGADIENAERFVAEYVDRRRAPADDLRDALASR